MLVPELAPLTKWLQAAARNDYGCSGDGGKVWVLPESFSSVFGFTAEKEILDLYCQQSELTWLNTSIKCTIKAGKNTGCELNFWFLDKVAFVLPVPVSNGFTQIALYVYPDIMTDPIKVFPLAPCMDDRCDWPTSVPRFHFIP